MNEDEAVLSIKTTLSELLSFPVDNYQIISIINLVRHFIKLRDSKNNPYMLSFEESYKVSFLNDIVNQIEKDLIYDKRIYLWKEDNPNNDYEKGVLNSIRLIQHRIHCICDF